MTTPTPAPIAACWSCQQSISPAAEQCMWCGAARPGAGPSGSAIPSALPPGMGGATPPASQGPLSPAPPLPGVAAPTGVGAPVPAPPPGLTPPAPSGPSTAPLSDAFRGQPAGTGARIAAFTIDVASTAAVVSVVFALTDNALFAAVALLECVVFLWVLEARTGLSIGNALLHIRASRADAPFSPGVGRSAARFALTGAGFFVGVVGAWVVVASSAWDGQRQRRGWAEVATRTMTLTPPRAAREGRLPGMTAATAHQAPRVENTPRVADSAAPVPSGVIERPAQVALEYEDSHSASPTIPPASPTIPPASPTIPPASPTIPPTASAPPPDAPTPSPGNGHGDLLLVFDTGQREQVALPAGLVLGRNPSPIEPSDHVIVVDDSQKTVSRTHLRIEHSRGRTWVTDNGSANGTYLLDDTGQSTQLVAHERTVVDDGMRVRIGERAFSINVLTDSPAGGQHS